MSLVTCHYSLFIIILLKFKFNKFLNLHNPHIASLIEAGCVTYNKIHYKYITVQIHYIIVRGSPPESSTIASCGSVEVTTYKDIRVRYVLRGDLLKAMQRLEEDRPRDKLKRE